MKAKQAETAKATIHLLCGSTGAGKTTLALEMQEIHSAMLFSVDDWMVSLFAPDLKNPMDWNWISERALRCENQMVVIACGLAAIGVSSVLDIGLLRASRRSEVVGAIRANECACHTHYLEVDAAERWRRIQQRNAEKGDTFRLTITREMFEFIETLWEPPTKGELSRLNANSGFRE